MFKETTIKRFWRYCALRDWYYSLDSSGFYNKNLLHAVSKSTGIPYNTIRQDLKHFQQQGWLSIHGDKIRFKRPCNEYKQMWGLYNESFTENEPPGVEDFCLLVKKRVLTNYIKRLAYYASLKISSNKERERYLQHLFDNSHIGAPHKLFFSLDNIARVFQKGKTTVWRYMKDLEQAGVVNIRRNRKWITRVPTYADYLAIRKNTGLYGRIYWQPLTGDVYERRSNDYTFV